MIEINQAFNAFYKSTDDNVTFETNFSTDSKSKQLKKPLKHL